MAAWFYTFLAVDSLVCFAMSHLVLVWHLNVQDYNKVSIRQKKLSNIGKAYPFPVNLWIVEVSFFSQMISFEYLHIPYSRLLYLYNRQYSNNSCAKIRFFCMRLRTKSWYLISSTLISSIISIHCPLFCNLQLPTSADDIQMLITE